MTETPEPAEAVPAPHPAWVGGSEEFHANIPASQAAKAWATITCANPQCRAKNDVWADPDRQTLTCWVCGRTTDLTTDPPTLVPRPEPGPDEEVTAP